VVLAAVAVALSAATLATVRRSAFSAQGAQTVAVRAEMARLDAAVAGLRQRLDGALVMAPMTRGSNLPYRRLCAELGARVLMSEMTVARRLKQRRRGEYALIRRAPDEPFFGVQLAGTDPEEMGWAAALVESRGAELVDVNFGCPIDHFTRKGMGAALGRQPRRIQRIVEAIGIPTLHITATGDKIAIPGYTSTHEDRIRLFEQTGSRHKTLVVFQDGSHSMFTDRLHTGGSLLNPKVKAATLDLTLAFLQAETGEQPKAYLSWPERHRDLLARYTTTLTGP
jgi:hypothetical protein